MEDLNGRDDDNQASVEDFNERHGNLYNVEDLNINVNQDIVPVIEEQMRKAIEDESQDQIYRDILIIILVIINTQK